MKFHSTLRLNFSHKLEKSNWIRNVAGFITLQNSNLGMNVILRHSLADFFILLHGMWRVILDCYQVIYIVTIWNVFEKKALGSDSHNIEISLGQWFVEKCVWVPWCSDHHKFTIKFNRPVFGWLAAKNCPAEDWKNVIDFQLMSAALSVFTFHIIIIRS